jgi:hypothetical protein
VRISFVLSPEELLEKRAALVAPPRLKLVGYHGVLAPNAADRAQIVLGPNEEVAASVAGIGEGEPTPAQRRHRLGWAVSQVWTIDVTECPACGGRMKIVAAVTAPGSIVRYLEIPGWGRVAVARPAHRGCTASAAAGVRVGWSLARLRPDFDVPVNAAPGEGVCLVGSVWPRCRGLRTRRVRCPAVWAGPRHSGPEKALGRPVVDPAPWLTHDR